MENGSLIIGALSGLVLANSGLIGKKKIKRARRKAVGYAKRKVKSWKPKPKTKVVTLVKYRDRQPKIIMPQMASPVYGPALPPGYRM